MLCISFLISCSIVVDFGLFHVHSHLILQHSPWFHWHSHTLQRLPASLLPPLLTFGRFCVGMLVSWPTFLQGKAVYFKIIQTHFFLFWRTNNVQDTATNSGVQIFPTNTHGTNLSFPQLQELNFPPNVSSQAPHQWREEILEVLYISGASLHMICRADINIRSW